MGKDQATGSVGLGSVGAGNKKRQKRSYSYEMTERDKVALRAVLSAKNACTALAIAIQSGKQVKPEAISACLHLQAQAADMLFA